MSLEPGTRLGPYEVVAPLGAGGMGEVYRARDTKIGRDVALKVLPALVQDDPDRLARFEREAQALGALNHPNIAQIYGFERRRESSSPEDAGLPASFIVMELVEGPTLADRIEAGPVPVDEAVAVARQIADALAAAHGRGIVHRDLKPANIKVRDDGTVKVLDFGLAKALGPESGITDGDAANSPTLTARATAMGMIIGTAAYMSPEQAKGRPVDQRADVWAFGVVLYEMLAGRRLFAGEDVSDTLAEVLKTDPDWRRLPPSTPSSIIRVLRRCLTRNPSKRMRDMHDVRLELDEPFDEAAGAGVATPERRGSRLSLIAPALILGLALGAAGMWLWSPSAPPASDLRFVLTPQASGDVLSAVLSPDGSRIVYRTAGQPRLIVRTLDAFEERTITGTDGAGSNFFFSPDGQWLAFYQGGQLKRLRFSGGDPQVICEVPRDSPGGHWGADGMIYFTPTWAGAGLWRVDADGGAPVQLTTPDAASGHTGHFFPWVLPDGGAVLFTVFGGKGLADSKIAVLDLTSGDVEILFNGARAQYVPSGHVLFYRQGEYQLIPFDAPSRRPTGEAVPVLPDARRLNPVGSSESYVSLSDTGVLSYLPGRSTLDTPESRLVWIDRSGGREELPFEPANSEDFSLSPDGSRVALTRLAGGEEQIWIYDLERRTERQLTRNGQNFGPSWHPDGRTLAVTSQTAGSFDVVAVAVDGPADPEPLRVTGGDEGYWLWASDGSSAVFTEYTAAGVELRWWSAENPADAETIVPGGARPIVAISPDRRWLAYAAAGELFVGTYPGLKSRVLIMTDAAEPHWSPSSRELFFVRDGALMSVRYGGDGDLFDAGAPTRLFAVPGHFSVDQFDVSPDGSRFLFRQLVDEAAAEPAIRVATNGLAELQRQVAR